MDKIIPYLTSAIALANYKLQLQFEDGVNGVFDLSRWKGNGVFAFWNDEKNFSSFTITKNKKLQWNEDIDMDPDAFYLELINSTFENYASNQQLLWHSH
jgi:Protein of unknown function (DUF2442)